MLGAEAPAPPKKKIAAILEPEVLDVDQEQAVLLVAEDRITDEEIARICGISRRTLVRWKQEPPFKARVRQVNEDLAERVYATGLAQRAKVLAAMHDRWLRMHAVIEARACAYAEGGAGLDEWEKPPPGANTGLLVRQIKMSPSGKTTVEYAVDVPFLKEIRELEKEAMTLTGQRVEKNANLNINVAADLDTLTPEDRERVRRALTGADD